MKLYERKVTKVINAAHGTYNFEITVAYLPSDKKYMVSELKRVDCGFESMLMDEEEIIKKIHQFIRENFDELFIEDEQYFKEEIPDEPVQD